MANPTTKRLDTNSFERDGALLFLREASIVPESYDPESDEIDIVWSAGGMVRRYDWNTGKFYWENLPLDAEHCDLSRLNNGAPFLRDHLAGTQFVLGVNIDGRARIEAGQGLGRVRFSKAESKQETIQDIRDGILRKISYAYDRSLEYDVTGTKDGIEIRTYRMHTPMETSAVAIAADDDAGYRGSRQEDNMDLAARNKDIRAEGARLKLAQNVIDELCDDATLTLDQARSKMNEAWAASQGADDGTPAAVPNLKERNAEIRKIGARAKVAQTVIDDLCDNATLTLEAARSKLHEAWAAEQDKEPKTDPNHGGRTFVAVDETDKLRSAIAYGLGMRSAPEMFPREKAPAGAEDFRGHRLAAVLLHLGERNGLRGLRQMSEAQMVDECLGLSGDGYRGAVQMTAGDFSAITSTLANLSVARRYAAEQSSYRAFCGKRTAPDFNDMTEISFGTSDVVEQLGEGGEIKFGKIVEGSRTWSVLAFAKRFGLSRKLIIGNRVDLLTTLPSLMVERIVTFEQNLGWGALLATTNLRDGLPLFHTDRGNIATVTGNPSAATLENVFTKMGLQLDVDGTPMNLEPANLLVPHGQRAKAATVLGGFVPAKATDATPDYMRGLGIVPEARLSRANPATTWYAACDPARHASIVYATLDGYEAPRVSSRVGWEVQGVEIKIEHDFGVTAMDGKGLVKITV